MTPGLTFLCQVEPSTIAEMYYVHLHIQICGILACGKGALGPNNNNGGSKEGGGGKGGGSTRGMEDGEEAMSRKIGAQIEAVSPL